MDVMSLNVFNTTETVFNVITIWKKKHYKFGLLIVMISFPGDSNNE